MNPLMVGLRLAQMCAYRHVFHMVPIKYCKGFKHLAMRSPSNKQTNRVGDPQSQGGKSETRLWYLPNQTQGNNPDDRSLILFPSLLPINKLVSPLTQHIQFLLFCFSLVFLGLCWFVYVFLLHTKKKRDELL